MSFKAKVDILVNINQFQNVDLLQMGLYFLKIQIYYIENDGQKNYAIPYQILETQEAKKQQCFKTCEIIYDLNECHTKSFYIKQGDRRKVTIEEIHQFSILLDSYNYFYCENLFMDCGLMFQGSEKFGSKTDKKYETFKQLINCTFQITNIHQGQNNQIQGLNEYLSIQFDPIHFCIFTGSIHTMLMQFKTDQDQQKTIYDYVSEECPNDTKEEFDQIYKTYYVKLKQGYQNRIKYMNNLKQNEKIIIVNLPESKYIFENEINSFQSDEVLQEKQIQSINIHGQIKKLTYDYTDILLQEINQISGYIFEVWQQFINILLKLNYTYYIELKKNHMINIKEKWGLSVFRNAIQIVEFSDNINPQCGKEHLEQAIKYREQNFIKTHSQNQFNVIDKNLFPKQQEHPILFEDIYIRNSTKQKFVDQYGKISFEKIQETPQENNFQDHIIILVHGYQGCAYDLRLFRNILHTIYPKLYIYISCSNEISTEGSLDKMGKNLANEVTTYLTNRQYLQDCRISFLGFSMGGVIIRSALPHLSQFKQKMHTFITLSSPHLGYMYNSNKLIDAGIWFLQKFHKTVSLQQLVMEDHKEIEDTYLYQLSQQEGLNWFNNIALVSSYQDRFIPFESGRILKSHKQISQNSKIIKYQEMAFNLMKNLKADKIHRIDVNFNITQNNWDKFIGRAAHILFLDSKPVIYSICHCFEYFFK